MSNDELQAKYDCTISNVVQYYRQNEKAIIAFNKEFPLRYYDPYPFDWNEIFTPIEIDAWGIIRSIGRIVLYPQYPVGKYRPDFANPVKKIILECDGKDYHDAQKDRIRDRCLLKDGWMVFRVSGSELYKVASPAYEEYQIDIDYTLLRDFYLNSAEGVIEAIRDIYFDPVVISDEMDEETIYRIVSVKKIQQETLMKHKLSDFDVIAL